MQWTRQQVYDLVEARPAVAVRHDLARIMVGGAWAESKWNPNEDGDFRADGFPCSRGLWQLNVCGGQGADYADNPAALYDPHLNRDLIVPAYVREYDYWTAKGYTGESRAWRVCAWAEKPYDYTNPRGAAAEGYRAGYAAAGDADPALGRYVFPIEGGAQYIDGHWDSNRDGIPDRAVDLFAPEGTPIVALWSGVAEFAEYPDGGHTVTLYLHENPQAIRQAYHAHLIPGSAVSGWVQKGQVIGQVGRSGNAADTPPHCHWAITRTHINSSGEGDIAPWTFLRRLENLPGLPEEEDVSRIHELEQQLAVAESRIGALEHDIIYKGRVELDAALKRKGTPGWARVQVVRDLLKPQERPPAA